jgi:FO synthase
MTVRIPENVPPLPAESAMRRALRRARDGVSLDVTEATVLLCARGEHLGDLLASASRVRDAGLIAAGRPGVITYSRRVLIPLTRTVPEPYLSSDEVLGIARRGAELGCKEALFTLGDRPEDRWRPARDWLDARCYDDSLSYVRAMAIRVLEETGLLPHLNPGVLTWQDFQRLKPVAPSMGMMLHLGSPDKDPAVRLRVIEDAGRCAVPFTTGILVGIGETRAERAESLFAIRQIAGRYDGIQEVIVQNFRGLPDADFDDLAATIAVARLVLGPQMRIQAPPNLGDDQYPLMLRAGIDDWGGVSPVTPAIGELAENTAQAGFTLRERLTIYPKYVLADEPWLDPRLRAHVLALADAQGLAVQGRQPCGRPWQEPDGGTGALAGSGRTQLHVDIDTSGRTTDRRGDFDAVYGDWDEIAARAARHASHHGPVRCDADVLAALRRAADDPAGISDAEALALLSADGPGLDALASLADDVRADAAGQDVTYVVTRNINFTNVCYTGCRFCAFAQRRTDADAYTLSLRQVGDRAEEAWEAGATEVCMQGGIHPDLPGSAYFDLAAEVKRRCPRMHVHAFSPMEVANGAARMNIPIREWLARAREAGVDSFPGTAAEILDDDVRWILTKGKLPAAAWIEVITTAHRLGVPTTATIMYGHVDTPVHWVGHLRTIAAIQGETGGFTEFVLLPFVHHNAPIYLAGAARPGPTEQENRALHAVARLLLHGLIPNIQCSWVKLGNDGCRKVLLGGVNDVGGTLMEETISRMAGSAHGSYKTISDIEAMVAPTGRPVRQRTTTYGVVPAERRTAALASDGVCASVRKRPVPAAR